MINKISKNSQKKIEFLIFLLLDKIEKTCYNNKAVGRERTTEDTKKNFQKSLKKDLTNKRKCGIINKSSAREKLLRTALHLEK